MNDEATDGTQAESDPTIPWLGKDGLGPVGSKVRERNEAAENLEEPPKGKKKTTATWQFKYRRYRQVLPFVDENAPLQPNGQPAPAWVSARNWRLILDLTDPYHKKVHEFLKNDPQCGADFSLLSGRKKTDTIDEKAKTLNDLMKMRLDQLAGMLTDEEKLESGLEPNCMDKMKLIVAIIDTKKLTKKGD